MKVSIIIPVYNVEPYVGECIKSVMAQDAQIPMECIVVDDRGTDNSMTVVNQLVKAYVGPIEFRIITRENNGGLSAARNSGIVVARGEYLYFLDSDDTITPDAIRLLWQHVEAHPGVDMVVGAARVVPVSNYLSEYIALKTFTHPSYTNDAKELKTLFFKIYVNSWNKLIGTNFLRSNKLKFKEGIIHEDLHQHLRIAFYVQSIAFSEDLTYNYRIREGSIMSAGKDNNWRIRVLSIISDTIENGYVKSHILLYVLNKMTDFGFEIQSDAKFEPVTKYYYNTLITIIKHLSFKQSLPFRYLQLRRPWMRVAILNRLAKVCF